MVLVNLYPSTVLSCTPGTHSHLDWISGTVNNLLVIGEQEDGVVFIDLPK